MKDDRKLDTSLRALGAYGSVGTPDDFMDGVWQRAGQLGEIAERRRRAALFCGLFLIGLAAGATTAGLPYTYGARAQAASYDFVATDQLSPATLLHVEG